jgi:dihydroorotate dehydrogenase (NAD+) catalytic subunit
MPKRDLVFGRQLMNAAGSLGFAPDPRAPVEWDEFGAFITNPVSMRPRAAAEKPTLIEYPGGFLLHTGLPNPGFRGAMQQHRRSWEQAPLPVIVNLMADRPDETRDMVRALEGLDNTLAVELGFAPLLSDDLILLAVEMSMGEVPVIVSLPAEQLLRLGPQVLERGAAALSIPAPRGALIPEGNLITGRLFGPALFPLALEVVRAASKIGLPIIGGGGVFSNEDAQAMLAAGAVAVELDVSLWVPRGNKKSLVN